MMSKSNNKIKFSVTLLGTGTSTGVPVMGCTCAVCQSPNKKNKRLRTSALICLANPLSPYEQRNILVDTSTDLRAQALEHNIRNCDAILFTHAHADHIFGFDDLRGFVFSNDKKISLYCDAETKTALERIFGYALFANSYFDSILPNRLELNTIRPYEPLTLGQLPIIPLPAMHGPMQVLGYRIGNFAYFTDCNHIPDKTREYLAGVEVLILDGLRYRPHPNHFTFRQAVEEIEKIQPKKAYLTHISHEADHDEANQKLASMTSLNVELAYDGIKFDFEIDLA